MARPISTATSSIGPAEAVRRACFICGGETGEIVARHDLDVCGLGRVSYALRCCDGCGLVLQDPAVAPAVMARQYEMFSNYTAFDAGDPPLGPTAGRMLAMTARAGLTPGQVYDVGASTGAMLWWFRRAGWGVAGCDLSPVAVEQARAHNDIALDLGACEETLPRRRALDLITLSHVVEHLYDPPAALAVVRAALTDGGCVLIEVPCLVAPERNPPGLFAIEHVNYFDETSLTNLLARAGFAVVEALTTLDHFPFPVITVLARKAEATSQPLADGRPAASAFCRAYAERDQASWRAIDARIDEGVGRDEPVSIWGAGVHTSILLSLTGLSRHAKIAAITDRDPQKHGHWLGEHLVTPPAEALESERKIVISSYVSEAAIARSLSAQGVAAERIVCLYG